MRTKNENMIVSAQKAVKAVEYFKTPLEISIIGDVGYKKTFDDADKAQLKERISGVKFRQSWINVKFESLETVVTGDEAESTVSARLEFEDPNQGLVYDEYPLKLNWSRADGEWFIHALEAEVLSKN